MLSKRYKSTEVALELDHMCPRVLWSGSSDTHQVVEIYNVYETSTKMYMLQGISVIRDFT